MELYQRNFAFRPITPKTDTILRSIEQKSPPCLAAINLFSTDPQLLEQLYQTFFKPFETTEQRFLTTPTTDLETIYYKLELVVLFMII